METSYVSDTSSDSLLRANPDNLSVGQKVVRILLGIFMTTAGIGHLTFVRKEFQAQVPPWVPMNRDLVVVLSGIIEIMLGASLVALVKQRVAIGWILALFYILVFPGNIAQLTEHKDAFGLDTDLARWLRLPFQAVLIGAALWSTGAWQYYSQRRAARTQASLQH